MSNKMEIDSDIPQKFYNLNKEDAEFINQCREIAEDIKTNKFTIVALVEQLSVYLIDKDAEKREYGTLILSVVLEYMPPSFLSSTQLSFICTFYADRLKDNHQVVPAVLKGILALTQLDNMPEGACAQILTSLFHNVPCQQQQNPDRLNIYKIFKNMLDVRESELKAMGLDFVYGVVSSIDSEKNPENLLILFRWIPQLLKSINLGHLTEEMFEVLSCYFPVDYRVPAQDANSVSREALATALNPCLCAIQEFGEFSIPLAIEKLTSTLLIAKIDSLELLKSGCKTFTEEQYLLNSSEIWSLIQKEILNAKNDHEIETLCLQTLTTIINKISESNTDNFKEILRNILDTLKGNMRPDTKLFEPSAKMLLSVADGSKHSCAYITSEIAPLLINLYNITTNIDEQIKLFTILISFVKTFVHIHGHDLNNVEALKYVPHLCLKASESNEAPIRTIALKSIGIISKSIDNETRACFYETLKTFLITKQELQVQDALILCLSQLSQEYPSEINAIIKNVGTNNLESLETYLAVISSIAKYADFTEIVLQIILNNCTKDVSTAKIGLHALKNVLKSNDAHVLNYIIKNANLINLIINWVVNNLDDLNVETSNDLLVDVSFIIKLIVGLQDIDGQLVIINKHLLDMVGILSKTNNLVVVYVLDGLLSRLRRDLLVDFGFIDDLMQIALNTDVVLVQDVSVQLLANLINKLKDDDYLLNHINKIEVQIDEILSKKATERHKINVVQTTSWITKALVMRGHSQSSKWINKLINLLEKYESASKGFEIVMNESYDSLSTKSYCNKKLLYRQMFFTQVCTIMCTNYNENNSNYLIAVGYLLRETPKQILKIQFEKIIKLIVLCLDLNTDPDVLLAVLTTLCALVEAQDELIENYIQEFLPRFLKLTSFEKSLKVRLIAIRCIHHYTNGYTLYKLLPHKMNVLTTLGKCLDDPKRLVRKEAVDARLQWYQLDAPI